MDVAIRGGRVCTEEKVFVGDVGIRDGKIAALGEVPGRAEREIDASGLWVLPGGIDAHCHIDQKSSSGIMTADDFESGSISAVFGGTTTIVPFAAQHRGDSLRDVVEDYHHRARHKAVIDYAFHLIVSDPTDSVLTEELPSLIEEGYRSFKVYMTYEKLRLTDYQMLDVLSLARRRGALTMVHAENHDMIVWLSERLVAAGHVAPRFHAVAHAPDSEAEATSRAIHLAELLDAPMLVVHVSSESAMQVIADAQARGVKVYGETCPQYLFLTAADLALPDLEGAKLCCSPPPRDLASQQAMWRGIQQGTLSVFSSDHSPYRFDETGKLAAGHDAPFTKIANGVPGIELRLPLLFSEGVMTERIDVRHFVNVTATQPAKLYGMFPSKGTIAVGGDADLAIWDPQHETTVRASALHDRVGYSPYEGRTLRGWPVVVMSRGRVVVESERLCVDPGSGRFIDRTRSEATHPSGRASWAARLAREFGASSEWMEGS